MHTSVDGEGRESGLEWLGWTRDGAGQVRLDTRVAMCVDVSWHIVTGPTEDRDRCSCSKPSFNFWALRSVSWSRGTVVLTRSNLLCFSRVP